MYLCTCIPKIMEETKVSKYRKKLSGFLFNRPIIFYQEFAFRQAIGNGDIFSENGVYAEIKQV